MSQDESFDKSKKKRTADATDLDSTGQTSNAPRILSRHRHRKRNVAATVWGNSFPGLQDPNAKPHFNVYKAIIRHPNLLFQFALRLPPDTFVDLYAIDKEFHFLLNKYSVSIIHDYAVYHAPEAAHIFSWSLFPELCITDPMLKPMDNRPHLARDIPSFRWTQMVLYRDGVVREILTQLALDGHRVPKCTSVTLMKFWIVMQMSSTTMRQALLQDTEIWSDFELLVFQLFLVKLDMHFTDPIVGNGTCELSHLFLTQKSLTLLKDFVTSKIMLDYNDLEDLIVKTYPMEELDRDQFPWLDDTHDNEVPVGEWGLLSKEGWNRGGARMESPLDLLIMESVRRKLHVHRWLLDFLVYGTVDLDTGENLPMVTTWKGGTQHIVEEERGWPLEEEREALIESLSRRFGVENEPFERSEIGLAEDVEMDVD